MTHPRATLDCSWKLDTGQNIPSEAGYSPAGCSTRSRHCNSASRQSTSRWLLFCGPGVGGGRHPGKSRQRGSCCGPFYYTMGDDPTPFAIYRPTCLPSFLMCSKDPGSLDIIRQAGAIPQLLSMLSVAVYGINPCNIPTAVIQSVQVGPPTYAFCCSTLPVSIDKKTVLPWWRCVISRHNIQNIQVISRLNIVAASLTVRVAATNYYRALFSCTYVYIYSLDGQCSELFECALRQALKCCRCKCVSIACFRLQLLASGWHDSGHLQQQLV
eukprot:scaffold44016_cov46-Prasinocladus_malaysianus.AAC.2